ncbi:MAG: hypothetical protein SGJ01_16895 [Gemmatimonadota bacterium]|nr:hypothetical protein [Gemmatimonadota bacterium]
MRAIQTVLALAVITLAACGKKPESAQTAAADTAAGMGGMDNMQGIQMMPQMRVHLDSIGSMQPTQMLTMMPAHQALASQMMDAMGSDMRGRNMQPDAAWTALADSVRQDLTDMPGLSGEGLTTRMQAHVVRMQRMMGMHQGMMHM